jgi:predicted RecA/RadA family phage recombinase
MAFGKPSITTPNAMELRSIAAAVSNARQRIEAIERSLTIVESTAGQSTSGATAQLAALRGQIVLLAERLTVLESAASVDTGSFIAGEAISAGQCVVPLGADTVGVADPNDPLAMFGLIGVATNTVSAGGTVIAQRRGALSMPAEAFAIGRAVYVDSDGGLTQTPGYSATALPIGVAVAATTLFVMADWPALQGPVFASAVGDTYARYLPVTYSMVQAAVALLPYYALPSTSGVDGDEIVAIEKHGVMVQITMRDIASYVIGRLSVSG